MPSPIGNCKQSVVLLVVCLFLLDCVVPSSVGSTVDIKKQSEENNDLPKHSTAKKKKKKKKKEKTRLGYVPLPLQIATQESPLIHRCTI